MEHEALVAHWMPFFSQSVAYSDLATIIELYQYQFEGVVKPNPILVVRALAKAGMLSHDGVRKIIKDLGKPGLAHSFPGPFVAPAPPAPVSAAFSTNDALVL